jgi:hypothetical protein
MSNDFKKVSVIDDRLNTTDSLNYAVFRGGQNVTNVRMPAISTTANSLNFQIPFPSESTVLDRELYLQTKTIYYLTFDNALPGVPISNAYYTIADNSTNVRQTVNQFICPLIYGHNISTSAFPTQRTMATIQVQINNNINTINSSDVLPALLRCSDTICWEKCNMTASAVDRLASCNDEFDSTYNNNMSSYDLVQGNKFIGNGSFGGVIVPLTSIPTSNPGDYTPNILVGTNGGTYTLTGTRFFALVYTSTEPIIAPPFIWNRTMSNRQGIYGIQNMSIVCNYGDVSKAIKYAPYSQYTNIQLIRNGADPGPYTWTTQYGLQASNAFSPWQSITNMSVYNNPTAINNFFNNDGTSYINPNGTGLNGLGSITSVSQFVSNAELQMKYITPHGNDVKPLRNVIPLLEFPRYISSFNFSQMPAAQYDVSGLSLTPSVASLSSQTYTFNQIPDKLIIFVRQQNQSGLNKNSNGEVYTANALDCNWNDIALAIKGITVQWNNHSGLLANATREQLFHMSQEAGSNQDWLSFSGKANAVLARSGSYLSQFFTAMPYVVNGSGGTTVSEAVPSFSGVQAVGQGLGLNQNAFGTIHPTIGSYLMLDLSKHLELAEPWNAPGSLGSYQLQFNLQVENYLNTPVDPEIVIIPVNSGIMVTEKGQTSAYTGILTKSDVLDAALQEPYSHMNIKRIVGHGHGDSSKALPKHVAPMSKTTVERMVGSGKPANLPKEPKEPKKEISNAERMASRLLPEVQLTEDQLLED